MKNPNRMIPEVKVVTKRHRAGFVPGWYDEDEVTLWQVWMHSSDGESSRRATYGDLEQAGFASLKTAESHGFGSQVAKVAKTQSINVTGPGKPGHQIDWAGEKDWGQWPDGSGE